jgi:hypothetical protein
VSAWELAVLKFHIRMDVGTQAQAAATEKSLALPLEGPKRLRTKKREEIIRYTKGI